MKIWVVIFLYLIFFSSQILAGGVSNISVITKGRAVNVGSGGSANQCVNLFSPLVYAMTIRTMSRQLRRYNHNLKVFDEHDLNTYTDEIVKKILGNWLQSGHYNEDQVNTLYRLDRSLSAMRTHYVSFEHQGMHAGIRIFDGSVRPYSYGRDWFSASLTDNRIPIEIRNPDLLLPGRQVVNGVEEPKKIIELGLLDGPRYFTKAVESAYAQVAVWLDQTYNSDDYAVFQRMDRMSDVLVYGVTRERLVPTQLEMGFELVMSTVAGGDISPMRTQDGLFLISISGQDFIRRHFNKFRLPEARDQVQQLSEEAWEQHFDQLTAWNRRVDQVRIEINSIEEANELLKRALEEYNLWARRDVMVTVRESFHPYRNLVESFYIVYASIPIELKRRHIPNWENLEAFLKDLLIVEDPRMGFDMFEHFLRLAEEGRAYDSSSPFYFDMDN